MQVIDLFSGIGGFSLAARWMGWQTVQFVEIDPFCQKLLSQNFPGIPIHNDVKTFDIDILKKSNWNPQADSIVCGGFP